MKVKRTAIDEPRTKMRLWYFGLGMANGTLKKRLSRWATDAPSTEIRRKAMRQGRKPTATVVQPLRGSVKDAGQLPTYPIAMRTWTKAIISRRSSI
jgi:hypothetical protein